MARPPSPNAPALQPLPEGIRAALGRRPRPRDGDNLGLWLDKYLPLHSWEYSEEHRERGHRHGRHSSVHQQGLPEHAFSLKGPQRERVLSEFFVARSLGKPVPWRSPAARDALVRQRESCEIIYGEGRYREYILTLVGRLVIDYARISTIEANLSFHATFGVPRIPGSALKGLLRAALRPSVPAATLVDLVGAPDLEAPKSAQAEHRRGRLVLHDALPESGEFQLDLDVLTPHFREYYEGDGKVPPADWLSPVPHGFLTVVATTFRLHVGLLPPTPDRPDEPEELLQTVDEALEDALRQEGLGIKRSAGYGRFKLKRPTKTP